MAEQTEQAQQTSSAEAAAQPVAAAPEAKAEVKTEAKAEGSLVAGEAKAPATKAEEPSKEAAVEQKFELKLPEGSSLDQGYVENFTAFAKERGLSSEQAQAILDREIQAKASYANEQINQVKQLNEKTWLEELRADKEIGGQNLDASGQLAFQGARFLFGDEGVQQLREMNFNHHPMLFRGFVKLGKLFANDKAVFGGNQTKPEEKSVAEIFYGKQSKE